MQQRYDMAIELLRRRVETEEGRPIKAERVEAMIDVELGLEGTAPRRQDPTRHEIVARAIEVVRIWGGGCADTIPSDKPPTDCRTCTDEMLGVLRRDLTGS